MSEATTTTAAPGLRSVPIDLIDPSPHNPRKHFAGLDELAASVKAQGVLLPLILRPFGNRFEIVAGERRWRAAKKAKLAEVPGIVRDLDDKQAREVMLDENLQREDLTAIEEADGYAELMKDFGYTVKDLELKFKRSESSIRATLKLRDLGEAGRAALVDRKISPSIGLLVARIPGNDLQARAVKAILAGDDGEPLSYRRTMEHIQRNFMLPLKEAPFDTADAKLVEKAGACSTCPKRTGNQQDLFPEIKSADVCTDPSCYRRKTDALFELKVKKAEEDGQKVLRRKEAAKIFNDGEVSYGSGFAEITESTYTGGGSITYETVAKKANIPTVLAQDPETGKIHELVPRKAAEAAAKKYGPKRDAAPRQKQTPAEKARLEKEEREAKERQAAAGAVLGAVVAAIEKKGLEPVLRLTVTALFDLVEWNLYGSEIDSMVRRRAGRELTDMEFDAAAAAFPKALAKMSQGELAGVLFELAVSDLCDAIYRGERTTISTAAKALGVDEKKVAAAAKKALEPPAPPPAPAKKKAAKK